MYYIQMYVHLNKCIRVIKKPGGGTWVAQSVKHLTSAQSHSLWVQVPHQALC